MKSPQITLTGDIFFRNANNAKAEVNTETGWFAVNIIVEDKANKGKIISPLSYNATVELYNSLLPAIMKLHKKIHDKGDGEYQFDEESIVSQQLRTKEES